MRFVREIAHSPCPGQGDFAKSVRIVRYVTWPIQNVILHLLAPFAVSRCASMLFVQHARPTIVWLKAWVYVKQPNMVTPQKG
jgi:hypothetical protein